METIQNGIIMWLLILLFLSFFNSYILLFTHYLLIKLICILYTCKEQDTVLAPCGLP